MASGFQRRGVNKVRRILRVAPDEITKPVKKNFERGSRKILASAKRKVKRRTGQLRRLLRIKLSGDKLSVKIGLVGKRANRKAWYGRILESENYKGGRFQFLEPAFKRHRDKMVRQTQRDIDEAIDRLAN